MIFKSRSTVRPSRLTKRSDAAESLTASSKTAACLTTYARENGNVGIQMWVVVQRTNLAELEALVDLAGDLGFGRLTFALDLNDWGQDAWA